MKPSIRAPATNTSPRIFPGAVYIDWTRDIVDPDDPVPVQVAPPERFAEAMASRGIGDETHVIAVDHAGGQYATRLWWALGYYGHDRVSVLDGGWNRWLDEGRPTEAGEVSVAARRVHAATPAGLADHGRAAQGGARECRRDWQLVDARDAGQYTGARRRGPRGGRIPGAIHVPRELFFAPGGGFLPLEEIRRRVEEHGVHPGRRGGLLQWRRRRHGRPVQPGPAGLHRRGQLRRLVERVGESARSPGRDVSGRRPGPIACHRGAAARARRRNLVIYVQDYHKAYRETVAVDGLTFEVPPGAVLGLIGPNGAGKTTTLRALAGIIRPTRGRLFVAGHDVVSDPLAAKRATGVYPRRSRSSSTR